MRRKYGFPGADRLAMACLAFAVAATLVPAHPAEAQDFTVVQEPDSRSEGRVWHG